MSTDTTQLERLVLARHNSNLNKLLMSLVGRLALVHTYTTDDGQVYSEGEDFTYCPKHREGTSQGICMDCQIICENLLLLGHTGRIIDAYFSTHDQHIEVILSWHQTIGIPNHTPDTVHFLGDLKIGW